MWGINKMAQQKGNQTDKSSFHEAHNWICNGEFQFAHSLVSSLKLLIRFWLNLAFLVYSNIMWILFWCVHCSCVTDTSQEVKIKFCQFSSEASRDITYPFFVLFSEQSKVYIQGMSPGYSVFQIDWTEGTAQSNSRRSNCAICATS